MIPLTLIHFKYFLVMVLTLDHFLLESLHEKNSENSRLNINEHPAVVVTVSTGKAAINVNDITFHSAFGLPVRKGITFTQLTLNKEGNFQKIM